MDIEKYEEIKENIIRYCAKWEIDQPCINMAFESDPCDITDPPYIRIKPADCDSDFHARHVLGHYLADLHIDRPDYIADKIAEML